MIAEIIGIALIAKVFKTLVNDEGLNGSDYQNPSGSNNSDDSDGNDYPWTGGTGADYPDTSRDFNPSESAAEAFRDVFGDDNVESI